MAPGLLINYRMFTPRQIIFLVFTAIIAGALVSTGTIYVLEKIVLHDPGDPLVKQGGLSPAQDIYRK